MEEVTTQSWTERKARAPQGLTVALAGFFPVMAIVSLAPAVPTLMSHFAGAPGATTLVPFIVTAPGLMIALLSPAMGWAADRFGRRPVMLWATLFYGALGTLPFLFGGLYAIIGSRLALGITEAAILTVTNTLIADYFDPAGRRRWLTIQAIIGPALGVATITSSGMLTAARWNAAFLIYLVAFPMFAAMLAFLFEPKCTAGGTGLAASPSPYPWPAISIFFPVSLFAAILYYVYIVQGGLAFAAIDMKDPARLGRLLAIASLGVPVGGLLFGLLSRRLRPEILLAIVFAALGCGMFGIGLARSPGAMTAMAFVQQIGAGMSVPTMIFWVSGLLPEKHRGSGFGFWTAAFFLGQFVSPVCVGAVRAVTNVLGMFATLGAVAFVGTLICLVLSVAAARRRTA